MEKRIPLLTRNQVSPKEIQSVLEVPSWNCGMGFLRGFVSLYSSPQAKKMEVMPREVT
jgi:hypothetical protein